MRGPDEGREWVRVLRGLCQSVKSGWGRIAESVFPTRLITRLSFPGPWWPDVQSLHHRPGAQSNGCPLKSIRSRFEGQKRVSSRAVTEACLLVAVPASIVFPPPGASEENSPPHSSTRTQLPQSMKIMHEIMYKLEVLYVLCVLLMGRQRNQVRPAQLRAAARRFPGARAAHQRPARLLPQRLWPWPSSARSRVP